MITIILIISMAWLGIGFLFHYWVCRDIKDLEAKAQYSKTFRWRDFIFGPLGFFIYGLTFVFAFFGFIFGLFDKDDEGPAS